VLKVNGLARVNFGQKQAKRGICSEVRILKGLRLLSTQRLKQHAQLEVV
jgi:hypothetical protein